MERMDSSLFIRAAVVQALLVGALFAVLVALPLDDDFFEDYGWITGPGRLARVRRCRGADPRPAARARPVRGDRGRGGGRTGGLTLDHTRGLVVAVAVFAASCAGYETARPGDAIAPTGIEPVLQP